MNVMFLYADINVLIIKTRIVSPALPPHAFWMADYFSSEIDTWCHSPLQSKVKCKKYLYTNHLSNKFKSIFIT